MIPFLHIKKPCSTSIHPASFKAKVRPRSFSLIEMLVSIAILAVLSSLLGPSLRRAMDQSESLACSSHLGNVGTGIQIRSEDYDGDFPYNPDIPFYSNPNNYDLGNIWTYILTDGGYISEDLKDLVCPAMKTPYPSSVDPIPSTSNGAPYFFTYGFIRSDSTEEMLARMKVHSIDDPSRTAWLSDSISVSANENVMYFTVMHRLDAWSVHINRLHLDTASVLFADGHVQKCDFVSLMEDIDTPNITFSYPY